MAPRDKRKRGDARSYPYDEDHPNRQSPHRPQNLALANAQQQNNSPRGGRRASRNSGRGGHNGPHSPSVAQPSPTAMAPPVNAYQASKPAPSTPSTPAKPDPAPEVPDFNRYLTPKRVADWGEHRKDVADTAITAQRAGDIDAMANIYYEINDACINQYMEPAELGSLARDILSAPCGDDIINPTSLFLDTLSTAAGEAPPYSRIKEMLMASDIDPHKMRCELESEMLIGLQLVRASFPKVGVRKATNALYRQTNYNLLREESEGFSKLMTEYFTTVNTEDPTQEAVCAAYQRVNAFIGAFDLDVGRVLDLTLDVFANLLVKNGKFFVKYLRASSWWPELQGIEGVEWEEPKIQTLPGWALKDAPSFRYSEQEKEDQFRLRERRDLMFWKRVTELGERDGIKAFFELGTRRATRNHREMEKPDLVDVSKSARKTDTQIWAEDWIAKTGTLPPPGNDIAAQLLGFKLQFYASDARDASDVLPENLIYLAALLIKIGFISIMDIYPHLYPADADMPAHREKLTAEKKKQDAARKGKSSNALVMAGALTDETLPAPAVTRLREAESKASSKPDSERSTPAKSDEEMKREKLPEPVDQKVALLRSLFCIGAIPEALFILGRFPWLLEVYSDLHAYIFRLAHHSLHKVYESSRPIPLDKIPSGPKGANALPNPSNYIPRRTLRWAKLDQKDAGDGIDYRFYWEDWMDNVPVCQSVDDVFPLCSSLLGLVGPECGRDILLMTKLARIGKKSVTEDASEANMKRWSDLSTNFLAPALTFTGQNPGVVNEMWELFKRFGTATRYSIYSHWFSLSKPAVMRTAFKDVQDDTRDLLGKLSATNTRHMGRAMAKLAYACPGIVFQQTLRQGQGYINMIDALVECSRYLTTLGYDCLTWTLVNTLVTNDRPTLQGDGMLVKGWLKNTAIFIGKIYRRYSLMDPTPVLRFVQHQLVRPEGEMYMLTVLERLINTMAGIELSGALTEARVLALSAGPGLRAYTLETHLLDHRHQAKITARRLLRCLKESGLVPQILIALAQQVQHYVFREELLDVPDKVVFTNFDHFRSNFVQYLEFLRENLRPDEFDEQVPSVEELMGEYGLEADLAFMICRDSLAVKISSARLKLATPEDAITNDVEMDGVESKHITNGVATPAMNFAEDIGDKHEDVDMKDAAAAEPTKPNGHVLDGSAPASGPPSSRSNPEIDAIAQQLRVAVPEDYTNHSFVSFVVTFWSLSLKDIYPTNGEELKNQYEDAKRYINSKANAPPADGRYRHESVAVRQSKEDVNKLSEEYQDFCKTAELAQSGLREEMLHWFSCSPRAESDSMHNKLIQDCFLPRLRMSLQDAQFASTMLFFMHRTGVPGFRLLKFLDQFFVSGKLTAMISSMSEEEVKCFGRFINDILRELQRWHETEKVFDRVAYGENKQLRGFAMSSDPNSPLMTYGQFLLIHCKWHKALYHTLKNLLQDEEYTKVRNSINILKTVASAFPKVDFMAADVRNIIDKLAKEDDRDDVKVAANSLVYEFKRSAKFWKTEAAFTGLKETPASKSGSAATSGKAPTPHPTDSGTAKLNAAATTSTTKTSETNGLSKASPNPTAKSSTEMHAPDDRKMPAALTTGNSTPRPNGRDTNANNQPPPGPNQSNLAKQAPPRDISRGASSNQPSAPSTSVPNRPETRNASQASIANRLQHALPTRPDAQPPRARQLERPNDRPAEYHTSHARHEGRPSTPSDYGRPERAPDSLRDRDSTRHHRSRSPARETAVTDRRDRIGRDVREYDDRSLRPPPRDARGPPIRGQGYAESPRDPRESREQQRDYRDREHLRERTDPRNDPRADPRGLSHLAHTSALDGRTRMHSSPILANNDPPHRREPPSNTQYGDRSSALPPRPSVTANPAAADRVPINPERAALINDDRARNEPPRHGRDSRRDDADSRRDRLSRPQSPRRDERAPAPAPYSSAEARRDYRDDRPPSHSSSRDRREEPTGPPPTGPRSGREAPTSQVSRDMFQPSQGSQPRRHQTQDPNYGRLNQPAEPIPSGPRNPASDRRDSQARQPASRQPVPAQASTAALAPPTAPAAAQPPGVHPSRLNNISRGPPLQTEGLNAPSGPRSANRVPPTGPASAEQRNVRQDNRNNPMKAINSLLSNNAPAALSPTNEKPDKRSGRERSRSPDRRGEDRPPREKRDRDGGRRDRDKDRDRDRSDRERRDGREGREERDRRGRGDRGDETRERSERSERKRAREATDQPHGDSKRRR
ncbi:hypothetical protein K458DRAFT_90841 [Lentithecium fluviatile CBS 122367]|uniref:THO complex subunit 2 n=1 Tax=Lentithecium fluviatile CBS 122367 TaxID=1168545 RepID=A0A6G1IR93_9PLEO|nr:hypothetical protein K458DRAFT_90841 [Lentithecium fluviatile CBS 122367]